MNRSKAILIFVTLFLCMVGYGAWCGRSFYLKTEEIKGDGWIPDDVVQVVRDWNFNQDLFGAAQFTWEEFFWLLQHPHNSDLQPIWMSGNVGYHYIDHPGASKFPRIKGIFIEEDWEHGQHEIFIDHESYGAVPMSEYITKEQSR